MTMRSVFATAEIRSQVEEEFGAVEGMRQTLERLEEELTYRQSEFVISRAFDAPRDLVYRVWTDCAHLSHWWGPKDITIGSCRNELRVGGTLHYAMRTADGTEIWGRWLYREIAEPERLVFLSSFSDPQGGVTRHPGAPEWPLQLLTTITFDERDSGTLVTVRWSPYDANELERATFAGGHESMRGGWTGTLDKLTAYLAGKE
jgi:uncharacterized protein YndB with AHSA1/START domain